MLDYPKPVIDNLATLVGPRLQGRRRVEPACIFQIEIPFWKQHSLYWATLYKSKHKVIHLHTSLRS